MREMQIKTTIRYHYHYNEKTDHTKCQGECKVTTTLILLVRMSTITGSSLAVKHRTVPDSAIPFSRDRKAHVHIKTCTQMFTVALFIAKY